MRYFILSMFLVLMTNGAAMATPITKDAANAYFLNCKTQPSQGLSVSSQEYMCACTAAKMMKHLTLEDVRAMPQPNETGRAATNKMLIHVYAPCMNYPAKDHYYNTCMSNPKTKTLTGKPERLCNCMSDKVAGYLGENGSKVFSEILSRDPNITDPMTALTNDNEFQKFAQSKLLGCVGM